MSIADRADKSPLTPTATWAGLSLPLDLGRYGLPGCSLYSDVRVAVGLVANAGGLATVRCPIGPGPNLIGARLFQQAVIADPGVNRVGAIVCDAAELVIGAR